MEKSYSKEKKILLIIITVSVLVIIGVILFVAFRTNKTELNKELENVGRNFYENYYYNQVGKDTKERAEFLSQFKEVGVKVDLENLIRASENKEELQKKFVNSKTNEQCNQTNTKVTIYPKDPFGQKDYTIETVVDCGFTN